MPSLLQAGISNAAATTVLVALALLAVRCRVRPTVAHCLFLLALVKLLTPPLLPVEVGAIRADAPETRASFLIRVPKWLPPVESEIDYPISPNAPRVVEMVVDPTTRGKLDPKTGLPLPPKVLPPAQEPEKFDAAIIQPAALRKQEPRFVEAEISLSLALAAPIPWWEIVAVIWLFGAGVLLIISLRRVRQFQRLLRHAWPASSELQGEFADLCNQMALRRQPRLRLLPGAVSPMVWAVGRPTVYFPAELVRLLSRDQRRTLLAHELAHLKRRDHWVRWIELAAVSLFWWLPSAWIARRGMHFAEEECCDSLVIDTLPDQGRAYASALLNTMDFLAEAHTVPAVASGVGQFEAFRRRLVLIISGKSRQRPGRLVRWSVTAGVCVALPIAPTLATLPHDVPPANIAPSPIEDPQPPQMQKAEAFTYGPIGALIPAPKEKWNALAISPDGRIVALGGEEGVVTLWSLPERKAITVLRGHRGVIAALAFSPDGRLLLSASGDNTARVWSTENWKELVVLAGHTKAVSCVAFSPDGNMIATGSLDRTVRLWRASNGNIIAEFRGHRASVRSIAFNPMGNLIASASADHTARIWNVSDEDSEPRVLRGHRAAVRSVAFQPDGKLLATSGDDGRIRLWNIETGEEQTALTHGDIVGAACWSPQGTLIVSSKWTGQICIWDARTGQLRASFQAHTGNVPALAISPDGRWLVSAGVDRTLRIWPAATTPTLEQLADQGRWLIDQFPPLARWLSLDEDRPGALWGWLNSPALPK